MAKFYGNIGFSTGTAETSPGVWTDVIVTKPYSGDVKSETRRWESGENLNEDVNVSNRISVIGDVYAHENFMMMRYIEWIGTLWEISKVDVKYPRLIVSIGGVYNGPVPDEPAE